MGSERPWALVLDFDGTLTLRDVADRILQRFAEPGRAAVDPRHRRELVSEAWVYEQYRRVKAPRERLVRYAARVAKKRPCIVRLAEVCRQRRIPIEVVSGGLDLYVDPLLDRWGLGRIVRYRASTRNTPNGLKVRYRFLAEGETLDRFKAGRVRAHRRAGRRVIFAGDGPSDFRAAKAADIVLARGKLLKLCRASQIPAHKFGDTILLARIAGL